MVPFDMLGMVSYQCYSSVSLRRADFQIFDFKKCRDLEINPGQGSFKVICTDTDRSATYDFLLALHSNYEIISYRFRDKRQFRSKIANFSHPRVFNAPAVPLGIRYRRKRSKN